MLEKARVLAVAAFILLNGCPSDSTAPELDRFVIATGVVSQIEDLTPLDGALTVTMERDGGGTELLYFGATFTYPPPSEEQLARYHRLRQKLDEVELGSSRVRALGIKHSEWIELVDLVILT